MLRYATKRTRALVCLVVLSFVAFQQATSTRLNLQRDALRPNRKLDCAGHGARNMPRTRKSTRGGSSRIAILSYSNLREDPSKQTNHANFTLYKMVRCNHEAYAGKYGYDYLSPSYMSAKWLASHFVLNGLRYKTFTILSHFDEYDVLVWIDHDAIFYNMDLSVEYWLTKMGSEADILMAEDLPGYKFNAGLQIIKTTNWTKTFYAKAIDELLRTDVNAGYIEQPIFYKLYDTLEHGHRKIKIHTPRNTFQAFLKVKSDLSNTSWVVHATQCKCDLSLHIHNACLSASR